jgi:hypothetical protein
VEGAHPQAVRRLSWTFPLERRRRTRRQRTTSISRSRPRAGRRERPVGRSGRRRPLWRTAGPSPFRSRPASTRRPSWHADAPDVPARSPHKPRATDGDALLTLAQQALAAEQQAHPDVARRRRPQLTARIDPLSGWARQADGELLPPTSLRTVITTLPGRGGVLRLRPVTDADLRRLDLGRTQREASAALREQLRTLDGERCRFPGCTRRTKPHAHHVVLWRDGGRTDLANLVLMCSRHHTLIHTHDFQLVLHPDRRLAVRTTDGVPVLHHPAQPWGDPAELASGRGRHVSAGTLPPDHGSADPRGRRTGAFLRRAAREPGVGRSRRSGRARAVVDRCGRVDLEVLAVGLRSQVSTREAAGTTVTGSGAAGDVVARSRSGPREATRCAAACSARTSRPRAATP